MSDENLFLPSLRGQIGDWIYYSCLMKFKDASERIKFAEEIYKNPKLSDMVQRELKPNRISKISDYILKSDSRFFNSIVIGAYGGTPAWYKMGVKEYIDEMKEVPDDVYDSMGIMKLSGGEKLFALDGQHRLAGIRKAISENSDLEEEEVNVIFLKHIDDESGKERSRRLFIALNRHAVKVSIAEVIALEENDLMAVITRRLVETYDPFTSNEIIQINASANLDKSDTTHMTTIVNLYHFLCVIVPEFYNYSEDANASKNNLSNMKIDDELIDRIYKNVTDLFDCIFSQITPLKELIESNNKSIEIKKYRGRNGGHLLYRPIGWLILAEIIKKYLKEGYHEDLSIEEFKNSSMLINDYPYKEIIWDSIGKKMKTAATNKKVIVDLILRELGFSLNNKEEIDLKERLTKIVGANKISNYLKD